MIRKRLGRIATALTTAALLGALSIAAPVSAATPGWERSNAASILDTVGPGKDAGYVVTIYNDGPGNISTVYLQSTSTPSYAGHEGCNSSGALYCELGALAVGESIELIVAFQVPTTTGLFSVSFAVNATGVTLSDKGKQSRGDNFTFVGETMVSTEGGDFDAGFVVGPDVFRTNQSVGRNNPQATTLEGAPQLTPVTIEDGISTAPCDSDVVNCSKLVGEWSKITVGDGSEGPLKVTILIFGNAVTGNPDPSELFLVHTQDDGTTNIINTACTYGTGGVVSNADCLVSSTMVGRNYQIVAWLAHNGNLRGGF